jgi:hypothetical protein
MNQSKKIPTDLNNLMPESCFMDLKEFNSEEVKKRIDDKEAHQKTVKNMLHETIKQHKRNQKK